MNSAEAQLFYSIQNSLSEAVSIGFRELFERKHLYQNLTVAFPEYKTIFTAQSTDSVDTERQKVYKICPELAWGIKNSNNPGYYIGQRDPDDITVSIEFTPLTVKMFCPVCENNEPYNFLGGEDYLKEFRSIESSKNPITEQIFVLAYQCQACKSLPEVFLVRRQKMKLIINGRSPMEKVVVPKFLPKAQRIYFSDAIIAFNSGQILAGNFLLRTFIEQFVREVSKNPKSEDIDALFDEYNNSLPDDFKKRFPSLHSVYSRLSSDIHTATASEYVFGQARIDIEEHFDAKRVYKIS